MKHFLILISVVVVLGLAFAALIIVKPPLPSSVQRVVSSQPFFNAGSKEDGRYENLLGTWITNKDASYSPLATIIFEPEKQGMKYELINNNFMASDFTYRLNGDTLEMNIANDTEPRNFKFELAPDGNRLVLTENGNAITYARSTIATGQENKY